MKITIGIPLENPKIRNDNAKTGIIVGVCQISPFLSSNEHHKAKGVVFLSRLYPSKMKVSIESYIIR